MKTGLTGGETLARPMTPTAFEVLPWLSLMIVPLPRPFKVNTACTGQLGALMGIL